MATDKEIGERLRQARKAAGFASATAAALALGMKYPTYAGHENGNRGLRANLEQYSRRFQVSMAWLLTGRGDGPGRNLSADQQEAIEGHRDAEAVMRGRMVNSPHLDRNFSDTHSLTGHTHLSY